MSTITTKEYITQDNVTKYDYQGDNQFENGEFAVMQNKSKARYIEFIKNHPILQNDNRRYKSGTRNIENEGYTLESELSKFMRDDVDKYQTFKHTIEGIETPENTKVTNIYAVEGFQPVVPLALMGIPTNMISQRRDREQMVLNIVINTTVNWTVSERRIQTIGGHMFNALIHLQEQGIKFNLVLVPFTGKDLGYSQLNHVAYVVLKSANEDLIPEEVVYGMVNPLSFRGLGFMTLEIIMNQKEQYNAEDSGYGRPIASHNWESRAICDILAQNEDMHNIIMINYEDYDSGNPEDKITDKFNGAMEELAELEQARQDNTLDQLIEGIQGQGGGGQSRNILNVHY